MNKIQRLIEQGLVIWVIWVVGVVVYYFVTGAYFGLYEDWFSDQLTDGVKFIVILITFPVYMYGLFVGAIRLYRILRGRPPWALNVKEGDRPQTIATWKAAISTAGPTLAKVIPPPKSDLQPHNTQRKLTRSHWIMVILFLTVIISGIVIATQQEIEQRAEEARQVAAAEAREARLRASVEAFQQSQARRAAEEARQAAAEAERQRQARAAEEARRAATAAERKRQARAAEEARQAAVEAERQRQTHVPVFRQEGPQSTQERRDTPTSYFTVGSQVDDVLRLQGTPRNIIGSVTRGTLYFGTSSVEIVGSKVRSWSDSGNLKVRLAPGSNISASSYFTVGSHVDDVLRLQGTPRNIIGSVTRGTLYFGTSSVEIVGSKVRSWSDSGNLKVRLAPGSNISASSYFTVGSHVDDVLRLQGTPRNIIGSVTRGTLYFGTSSVEIVGSKVRSWSDRGNLKVRLAPRR